MEDEPMTIDSTVKKIASLSKELEGKNEVLKFVEHKLPPSEMKHNTRIKMYDDMITLLEDMIKRAVILKNSLL